MPSRQAKVRPESDAAPSGNSEGAVVYTTTPVDVPIHRYRVMYTDGYVEDFLSSRDDSNIRDFMVKAHWGTRGQPKDVRPVQGISTVVDMGVEYVHHPVVQGIDTDNTPPRTRTITRRRPPGIQEGA